MLISLLIFHKSEVWRGKLFFNKVAFVICEVEKWEPQGLGNKH